MPSLKSTGIPILKIKRQETGKIRDLKKIVARIEGLPTCLNGELLDLGDGVRGIVMGFDERFVLALVLGDENKLRMGKEVTGVSEPFKIPVGNDFIGRMVTALAEPCDGRGPIVADSQLPVFRPAASILDRALIKEFLCTGTKVVDAIVPIGRGQRQLIVGDRLTGKSVIAMDAILNQSDTNTVCIYCSIGKPYSALEKAATIMKDQGALDYTVIMAAFDSSPAGEQYLLPFCAASMGDYFISKGRDVLMVMDDLTKHAWAYRQLSLLLERPPGREAYPGDIFYVHTQLMERAGQFSSDLGGASMTFLALAETLDGDLTGYIPSNLISMCDGVVFLDGTIFSEGMRPAVDFGQSFSITGGKTQPSIIRKLSSGMRAKFVAYTEITQASRLQGSMSEEAEQIVKRGDAMMTVLQQDQYHPSSVMDLSLVLYALKAGMLDDSSKSEIVEFRENIAAFASGKDPSLVEDIEQHHELTQTVETRLSTVVSEYFAARVA